MSGSPDAVRERAGNRCEYCRLPQGAFRRGLHIEHIIARQHSGSTSLDNLALACWTCNLKKGPNLSGIDPATGVVTALFHPRKHQWSEHFSAYIASLIPVGIQMMRVDTGRQLSDVCQIAAWTPSAQPIFEAIQPCTIMRRFE